MVLIHQVIKSSMNIDFCGIGHRLTSNDLSILNDVALNANTYTQGPYQEQFEADFLSFLGSADYALATSNAVSAIELIADELNLSSDDEIICTSHTYCASIYPFLRSGARVVWCDIDEKSWLSEGKEINKLVTQKTKAIIIVHLYGLPSNCVEYIDAWKQSGITIIEDCAQAIGASINENKVGTKSDFSVFSFQSHKNISTLGEGGMLIISDHECYKRMRLNRHNGHTPYLRDDQRYWKPAMTNVVPAYLGRLPNNYCLNEFSCAIGSTLLPQIPSIINKRKSNSDFLRSSLHEPGVLEFQDISPSKSPSYHLSPVRVCTKSEEEVDKMLEQLYLDYGIKCAKQYYPLYNYELFADINSSFSPTPIAETFYEQMISLPFHDHLSVEELEYICEKVRLVVYS